MDPKDNESAGDSKYIGPSNKHILLKGIGSRIRSSRYRLGWGQDDLAEKTKGRISRCCISYFENGKRLPSLSSLIELSSAMGMEPAILLLNPKTSLRHEIAQKILMINGEELSTLLPAIKNAIRAISTKYTGFPEHVLENATALKESAKS